MKIRAAYEPSWQRVGLYFTSNEGGKRYKVEPLILSETKQFEILEPAVSVDDKLELQDLIDDLWSMGLRPSARADEYKAQLSTMRDHLNDMRTLVFKKRDDLKGVSNNG